ncbi:hypothetical protein B0H16DRAFT_1470670 [Mycena metata]|uniref:Uncharacterized protein n=1 Tax=Mycena metata TaxID=1033252 RepID=A0AAD7HTV7_9AGAR|nr:hypothetical protein B0H16DRAFT_1470670 [Mycena metata]
MKLPVSTRSFGLIRPQSAQPTAWAVPLGTACLLLPPRLKMKCNGSRRAAFESSGQGALCPSANWTLVTHRAVESVSDYARACHTIGGMYDFSQFKLGDSVDDLANGWIIAESLFTVFLYFMATLESQANSQTRGWKKSPGAYSSAASRPAVQPCIYVWAFFFIAASAARSNLRFLIDVTPGAVGTANMLIYVRVGFYDGHTSLRPRRRRLLSDSRALNPLRVRSRDDTSRYYRPTNRRGREPLTLGEDAGSGTHVNGNKAV